METPHPPMQVDPVVQIHKIFSARKKVVAGSGELVLFHEAGSACKGEGPRKGSPGGKVIDP
jgi:hypothetical protein